MSSGPGPWGFGGTSETNFGHPRLRVPSNHFQGYTGRDSGRVTVEGRAVLRQDVEIGFLGSRHGSVRTCGYKWVVFPPGGGRGTVRPRVNGCLSGPRVRHVYSGVGDRDGSLKTGSSEHRTGSDDNGSVKRVLRFGPVAVTSVSFECP